MGRGMRRTFVVRGQLGDYVEDEGCLPGAEEARYYGDRGWMHDRTLISEGQIDYVRDRRHNVTISVGVVPKS